MKLTAIFLISAMIFCISCRTSNTSIQSDYSTAIENMSIIITDKQNKIKDYADVKKEIEANVAKSPISIKIYAFLTLKDNCTFNLSCNVFRFTPPYSRDIYFSSSTSVKSDENSNEYKAASSIINISGVKNEITYNLGLVVADNISKNISIINNSVSVFRDKSIFRDETNKAKNLTQSLKSYVESPQSDPIITKFFYKYVPLVPIILDLASPFFEDVDLYTGRISLLKSSNYIPDLLDVISQGGSARMSYIVVVDQYTFTSNYLIKEEILQTFANASFLLQEGDNKSLPPKIKDKLILYATINYYHKFIDSLKDIEEVKNTCIHTTFIDLHSYYRNLCGFVKNQKAK